MRVLKIIGIIAVIGVLVYVLVIKNSQKEDHHHSDIRMEMMEDTDHDHQHENGVQEPKPYYQGEIIKIEQGGGYTYLEILEKTDMSFWIVVEKVDAKVGDYVMFQEDLVAKDFYSKTLDRNFEEIMFATNLQYRVSE